MSGNRTVDYEKEVAYCVQRVFPSSVEENTLLCVGEYSLVLLRRCSLVCRDQAESRPVAAFCVPRELRGWATDSLFALGPELCRPVSGVCLHQRGQSLRGSAERTEPCGDLIVRTECSWQDLLCAGNCECNQLCLSHYCQQFNASREYPLLSSSTVIHCMQL